MPAGLSASPALLASCGLLAWRAVSGCGLTADWTGIQGGTPDGGALPKADGGAGVGTPIPFCASLQTPVQFCADFDEGGPVQAGWDTVDLYNGAGTISLSPEAFSAPSSFQSALFDLTSPLSARLVKQVTKTASHARMEFELKIESAPTSGTLELAALHENVGMNTYGVFFEEVDGALRVEVRLDNGIPAPGPWTIGPPPSGWTNFVIDVDISDSGSVTVQEGTATVLSASNVQTSVDDRDAMFVELGFYDNDSAAAQATFDNVIVDWP